MRVSTVALFLLLVSVASSYIVVNSEDGRDVASVIFYAHLQGEEFRYLPPNTDLVMNARLIGHRGEITLFESTQRPTFIGFDDALKQYGNSVEIVEFQNYSDLNLELAGMAGTSKFIITDPNYGDNIVVLISYAKATGSYVLFATKDNADEVSSFLSSSPPSSLLVYGYMDGEVTDALDARGVSYETIDNEDRYLDNIALAKKFFAVSPETHTVLFSDGRALENSIDAGVQPVLLISSVIPDPMHNFILQEVRDGQIGAAVLVGSTHLNPVYNMMKTINAELGSDELTVMVKFGQSTSPDDGVGQLTMFPLPAAYAEVMLDSAKYNTASGMLELVFSNAGTARAFVQSNTRVLFDGEQFAVVGDEDPFTIRRGESKGMKYPLDLGGRTGDLAINSTVYYGITRNFDYGFIKYMGVGIISYSDNSVLSLLDAEYLVPDDTLSVKAKNNGTENVYYRLSAEYTNPEGTTVFEDGEIHMLEPGHVEVIQLTGLLLDSSLAQETEMTVTAEYGGREAFLEKSTSIDAVIDTGFDLLWLLLLLLLLIAAYLYYRKKKGGEKKAKPKPKKK